MARERKPLAVALAVALLLGLCRGDVVQFIFGDSLSDVGNNNYLTKSLARAATPWYGIDFGRGMPNGRFCNGRTVADIVGDKMGLPRPPAFLDPSLDADTIFKNGVNYASGGGGILNETSSLFQTCCNGVAQLNRSNGVQIQRFSLYKQIELFQGTQAFMREKIGAAAADKFFGEGYYVVAMGANDFINNYLLPVYSDSWTYNGDTFVRYMVDTLEAQLRLLHALGARRLTFFGLGPMGCIPLQRYLTSSGGCQESTNKLARSFNAQAGALLARLSSSLPNATFRFGDAYDYFQDIIDRPYMHGFNNSRAPCCTLGRIRPTLTCTPLSTLCKDRSKYVFWDEYHPTDRANELIALETLRKLNITVVNNATSS
ncbi:GDSL esterase/lipase [Panicum miliaceum]|uniref:GDSL esterase/lipase n=1 Tax=Panicum miliaceum TaxID=4540 RepID=A0A3L6PDY4_PANMI|nr:GDSL esterase/lipase [Panicum miliaceum]